uniref:Trigger factor n=1 Tax=Lygus hesperus TaxID=30085 RepID=A0A0A9WFF3_LYGHE
MEECTVQELEAAIELVQLEMEQMKHNDSEMTDISQTKQDACDDDLETQQLQQTSTELVDAAQTMGQHVQDINSSCVEIVPHNPDAVKEFTMHILDDINANVAFFPTLKRFGWSGDSTAVSTQDLVAS